MEVKTYERNFLLELRHNPLSLKMPLLPYISFIQRKKQKQRGRNNPKLSGELQDNNLEIVMISSVVDESLWVVCPLPAKGNPTEQRTFMFTPTRKKKFKKEKYKKIIWLLKEKSLLK